MVMFTSGALSALLLVAVSEPQGVSGLRPSNFYSRQHAASLSMVRMFLWFRFPIIYISIVFKPLLRWEKKGRVRLLIILSLINLFFVPITIDIIRQARHPKRDHQLPLPLMFYGHHLGSLVNETNYLDLLENIAKICMRLHDVKPGQSTVDPSTLDRIILLSDKQWPLQIPLMLTQLSSKL